MTEEETRTDTTSNVLPTGEALERRFLYQSSQTGEISSVQLSTRQLCRLLCPASLTTTTASTNSLGQHIKPETNLLALEPDGSYSKEGWKPANTIPIIREAVAHWYYECAQNDGNTTQGPVSCRALATLVNTLNDTNEQVIAPTTRVFSNELTPSWTSIQELPNLQFAMDAFDVPTALSLPSNGGSQKFLSKTREGTTKGGSAEDQGTTDEMHDELEAFLSSTDHLGPAQDEDSGDEDAYESDGGTRYVKDHRTGNWIHEDLAPQQKSKPLTANKTTTPQATNGKQQQQQQQSSGKKRKKPKFSAKNAKCWVYVTGLPSDTTIEELSLTFSKAGIIDLDPETQKPKIKLYKYRDGEAKAGECKGDASICYARPESVDLAITLLDEAPFRPDKSIKDHVLHVERAKFQQHGEAFEQKRVRVSEAKRKVAKMVTMQAMDWDDGRFNGRLTGGRKGLHIIVLKHMFNPEALPRGEAEDEFFAQLQADLRSKCEDWGPVEKITVFSQNPDGVVVVKFTQPGAASDAVKSLNGTLWKGNTVKIDASFWDGVTDYTVRDEAKDKEEAEVRHEQFGQWLEEQDLPEELQLKTES